MRQTGQRPDSSVYSRTQVLCLWSARLWVARARPEANDAQQRSHLWAVDTAAGGSGAPAVAADDGLVLKASASSREPFTGENFARSSAHTAGRSRARLHQTLRFSRTRGQPSFCNSGVQRKTKQGHRRQNRARGATHQRNADMRAWQQCPRFLFARRWQRA